MANGSRQTTMAAVIVSGLLVASPGFAGPLDPMQFQSLGNLALTAPVTYILNTTGPSPTLLAGTNVYTGVIDHGIAVFDFSSVNIANGATLMVNGGFNTLPVALLSQSTEIINGSISVSALGYQQGSGASNTGVGGQGNAFSNSLADYFYTGPGGGGFGGSGGMGQGLGDGQGSFLQGGAGGRALANLGSILQGGSAGGSGFRGPGGAGGGAIELGATQSITIGLGGGVAAVGGDYLGGGGSGGGIFIHAPTVVLQGTLDVHGGSAPGFSIEGHDIIGAGGAGGGGAVLIEYSSGFSNTGVVNTKGGPGSGDLGFDGVFTAIAVPEPSSLILLGTSTFGLIGVAAVRRRSRRETRPRDGYLASEGQLAA